MKAQFKALCLSTSFACLQLLMAGMAVAQTGVIPPQTPLSDVDCNGGGPFGSLGGFPPCDVNGTRTVTLFSEGQVSTPFGDQISTQYQVNFDGQLAVDGIPIGMLQFDPANFYNTATVDISSQYVGELLRPLATPAPTGDPNTIGYFHRYSEFQTTVHSIGVDIQDASAHDVATGQDYIFNLASIDPNAIMNGDRTALAGNYKITGGTNAIAFGKLTGNAVVSSGSSLSPSPFEELEYLSPYALQYQVTAQETTRLDENGLVTPTVSVTDGINMNGSTVRNLADGVSAGDAVNKGQLDAEANARIAGDAVLASQVANEAQTRAAADTVLATSISSESGQRQAADAVLSSRIADEANTRQAADVSLTGLILNETQERAQADLQLRQRIDNEGSARAALAGALLSETNARMTADLQLSSRIDVMGERLDQIDGRLDRLENRVSAGTAVAVAMGGATFLPDMKFNLTANVATYDGAHAGAMQVGALISSHVALNAGVATSFNRGGKTATRAGVTIGW